jgi:hypothetical protein
MAASERLRIELNWPESARPQMMLGALAPDAHTEAPDYDRTSLHPEPGTDIAAYVIEKITPEGALDEFEGQAFALSVIAHLVADEFTRPLPADMPWDADRVYRPPRETETALVLDWPVMRRDLQRAAPLYGMGDHRWPTRNPHSWPPRKWRECSMRSSQKRCGSSRTDRSLRGGGVRARTWNRPFAVPRTQHPRNTKRSVRRAETRNG